MVNDKRARVRKPLYTGLLAAVAGLSVAMAGNAAAAPEAAEGQIVNAGVSAAVDGSYIVKVRDQSAVGSLAAKYGAQLGTTYSSAFQGFSAKLSEKQAKRLAADSRVEYVEQDAITQVSGTQTNPVYGLDRIDQRNLPLNQTYTYPNEGAGVNAYVLDTGIYLPHPDFGGRAKSGYDFIDNDTDASDCQGHGTHVAGTVGGKTYGVAKGVNLISVRVLNCQGSGQWSQIIAGIDWVAKNAKKPAVINMSLGGGVNSSVDTAVRNASNAGVTVVVASGNSNANACNSSPARTPEAITVNATDSADNRASFSNFGTCSDIFAPGVNVTSTKNGGGTTSMSGTSMASPHVAGAAALYLASNPSASPAAVQTALKNAATSNVVKNPGTGSPNKLLFVG